MSKLTKEQLQGMSDSEVNKSLERLTGIYCEDCVGKYIKMMDYCNTPNDIMPLAFEHFICLSHTGIDWVAFNENYSSIDVNPLRAIACCLILVLQGDKL